MIWHWLVGAADAQWYWKTLQHSEGWGERKKGTMGRKGKAVVVGGSIAGLSCAHALLAAGWKVVVVEKTCEAPKGSPTGAGLALDPQSQKFLQSWVGRTDLVGDITVSLAIDENRATDSNKKNSRILTRDERFNCRGSHWSDLHGLLCKYLPSDVVVRWGHQFLSFQTSDDKASVTVQTKVLQTDEVVEIHADLLIAADGCLSAIRRHFLPDLKLRYSGYVAWRGVHDFSGNENSDTIAGLRRVYPDLGHCLHFDLATRTHSVLYELMNKRINWLWYINQPEPELKGNSVTMKVSNAMIEKLHEKAEEVWLPELAQLIKETKEPFLNVIYDSEPLQQLFWDNVVLVGDAAHPTTPHGVRSTNMSIVDAGALGQCLERWRLEELNSALKEYQSIRLPVVSKQVLHSRRMGRIKQGFDVDDGKVVDPLTATPEECEELQQRKMPFFGNAPLCVSDLLS